MGAYKLRDVLLLGLKYACGMGGMQSILLVISGMQWLKHFIDGGMLVFYGDCRHTFKFYIESKYFGYASIQNSKEEGRGEDGD